MRSIHSGSLLLAALFLATGCASRAGQAQGAQEPKQPGPGSTRSSRHGSIALTITADRGALADGVVSLGVPFPPGELFDASLVRVVDSAGREVRTHTASLATWPEDQSQRSVLVALRATLAAGESRSLTIEYGVASTMRADEDALAPSPDGPAVALLPPAWYARSRVIGYHVPAAQNTAFPAWEAKIERYLAEMYPAWQTYGLSCQTTALERTYYDAPHAFFQRFIHHGTPDTYRRAREEATWYRANELGWHADKTVALYACAQSWDPAKAIAWKHLRSMLVQGMADDYLLTGDPEALRAARGLGEAYRQNLPALMAGPQPAVLQTERNLGWPLIGLASYYAVEQRPEVRAAITALLDAAVAWQNAGQSGAFEHDIHRADPDECGDGPRGASPFMTSLLIDGLMEAWFLIRDPRIPDVVVRAARWYREHAINQEGVAFQYLWGCRDTEYHNSAWADLNLLIVHVFGAAYHVSGDHAWLDFGDTMARHGIEHMYAGRPKNWTQATRSFMRYMGYRALGRAP